MKVIAKKPLLFASGIILCFTFAYFKSFETILVRGLSWHILILIIAMFIIWSRKEHYFNVPIKPNVPAGTSVLLISFLLLFIGSSTSTLVLSEGALITGIWGIVIYIGGFSLFKRLFWPLAYLCFISSAVEGIFEILTPFYRHTTAIIAVFLANKFGFLTFVSETYIRLPSMILNVADECSGINHLISLFALAIPLAVLTQRNWWASSLLIGLSIPISLFANSIRVLLLILFNFNQTVFSHGPKNLLYTSSGFFIGLALLFLTAFLLSALTKRSQKLESKPALSVLEIVLHKKLLYLFPILITGALFSYFWRISPDIVIPKDISQLNSSEITITKNAVFPGFDSLPSADIEYKYSVINQTGQQWYLYTGWYEMQRQGKEVSGYWYDRLLYYDSTITFSKDTYPIPSFRVCRMKNDTSSIAYLIAYKSKYFTTSNPYIVKLYSAFEGLINRTTSCTIIIIAIPKNDIDRLKDNPVYSETFKEIGQRLIGPHPPAPSPIRIVEGES